MFQVYVLRSEKTGRRYIGSSQDVESRLNEHNSGRTEVALPTGSHTRLARTLALHEIRLVEGGRPRPPLDFSTA